MNFQTNIKGSLERNGLAIARDSRAMAGGGGLLALFAAAAAVAAVPGAETSDVDQSSVTLAIPAKATPLPDTVFADPKDAAVQLSATLQPEEGVSALLTRSGVAKADVKAAAALVAEALPAGVAEATEVEILLGANAGKGWRRLERFSFQPGRSFKLTVGRTMTGELKLARDAVSVDATPQHFHGRAGHDLFWSLRAAGVPAQAARDYLDAIASRTALRQVSAKDEFDVVIDHVRDAAGKTKSGPLLYAGLRQGGKTTDLVRWTIGDRDGWYDPSRPEQRVEGFEQPVRSGRITSGFGYRIHPILRFARFHDGVDIGAAWGAPVFAAADGVVSGAGWSGGYGQQVRLAHSDGVMTSYSHLSRIIAAPGTRVQRGQIIGLVGSSGFSTGPHVHFEVRKFGRPVDPATVRQTRYERIGQTDLAALRARLEQLRSI